LFLKRPNFITGRLVLDLTILLKLYLTDKFILFLEKIQFFEDAWFLGHPSVFSDLCMNLNYRATNLSTRICERDQKEQGGDKKNERKDEKFLNALNASNFGEQKAVKNF
jgi:hypothetical protein